MSFAVRRFLSSSLIIWLAISVYGVYFLLHLKESINFGIDLVGGTYITLEVQTDKFLENELTERVSTIKKELVAAQRNVPISQRFEQGTLFATFVEQADAQYAQMLPFNKEKGLVVERDGVVLRYKLSDTERKLLIQEAVDSNISVLRTRVDKFGVGEVAISAQGEKSIVVELPNVQDVQRAKAMLGTSALLEVKPVLDMADSAEDILKKNNNCLPEGTEIVSGRARQGGTKSYYLVPRYTDLTGKLLKTAHANPTGGRFGFEPVVDFEFKSEGGDKFYEMTRKPGAFIAMIVDGVVVTAANAREPLRSKAYIEGNFTIEEAQELASLLRSGAFVAPVTFEEDRTIAPTLGQESIQQGLVSCLVGMVLLFIFGVVMYKTAGLLAFIVLLYNLLLILFALSWLGATLTLPGIAGMVLTVGMAIDSSILIYERIREELARGLLFSAAVQAGFEGATVVILDANITTFLIAVVLYKLGAGAIQGFAVTMIVGIIATLITGLVLLKSIFNFLIYIAGVTSIKI